MSLRKLRPAWASVLLLSAISGALAQSEGIKPFNSGRSIKQAVIDTREGEQITTTTLGGLAQWPENPPIRKNNPPGLLRNRPPLGGTTNLNRALLGRLFPGTVMDGWAPPDCTVAVGENYIVTTVNMKIAFFRKSDGVKVYEKWLGNQETGGFFRSLGALDFTFDPKVTYDRLNKRFIVAVLEYYTGPNRAFMDLAVSDDADPNGVWNLYRTNSVQTIGGQQYWVDYTSLGLSSDAVFIGGNLFGFSSGFAGAFIRSFPLAPLLSGQPATYNDFRKGNSASLQGATSDSTSSTGYFVEDWSTNQIQIHAIKDPATNPVLYSAIVSVPSYAYPNSGAPQKGSGSTIDTLDGRIMNAFYRDGKIVSTHAVRSNSGNRTVGRWYEFKTNNWPDSGSPTLTQSGNADSGSQYHLFPAVALNDFNDMGMVVGRSSSAEFAGVYNTGRKVTDPQGTIGALQLAKIGSAAYTGGRWGDFFGIAVDPVDGLTFWGIGEYSDNPNSWSTWVSSFQVAEYRSLTVNAVDDGGNQLPVPVTIDTDGKGQGNGIAPILRTYYKDTVVKLSVPATFNGLKFVGWASPLGNAGISINNPNLTTVMRSNNVLTARYAP